MVQSCRIAITGAGGFLGWHIRAYLHAKHEFKVKLVHKEDFKSSTTLALAISQSDVILHLAGMNRGSEQDVYETNIRLARLLIESLESLGRRPAILFANSIHAEGDTPFGRSKRKASDLLSAWSAQHGVRYSSMVLPHLFGEGGRPFYNSGFATFCHQLVQGEPIHIEPDGRVELIHAQRVARLFLQHALNSDSEKVVRIPGIPMGISELVGRLQAMHDTYSAGVIPDMSNSMDLEFFNTYRSYLYPDHYPIRLTRHSDNRGDLVEAVKSSHGGQAFLSTTHPGITRGRHYHHRKVERFFVASGDAEIRIRRLFEKKIQCFRVSGTSPCYIDIPTFHAHDITNIGTSELLTLFWSHEFFSPTSPDTYPEPVTLEP